MSECSHDCKNCGSQCGESLLQQPHPYSRVKKVIAVVSGKGGVGKSSVSAMLAVVMARRGYRTAILDADVTGPSIPRMFGIRQRATGDDEGMYPVKSKTGISIMSVNLLLEDETAPVIWRGSLISGAVTQFWTDVIWSDVDYMFVDMPPGTGDVALTVFQSLPVDGIVMVTSPQGLVSMVVEKAVKMAEKMNVPVLGLIENYSYLSCPDCGKRIPVFGESHIDAIAAGHGLPVLARIPLDPALAKACDGGLVELFEGDFLEAAADVLEKSAGTETGE